jgi:hypothetical protein
VIWGRINGEVEKDCRDGGFNYADIVLRQRDGFQLDAGCEIKADG